MAQTRIELVEGFQFSHEPRGGVEGGGALLGRTELADRLATRIAYSNGGSFLLFGYRGVGKTSLVNEVLAQLPDLLEKMTQGEAAPTLIHIPLAIARPIPPENLLYQMICGLRDELARKGIWWALRAELRMEIDLACLRTSRTIKEAAERGAEVSMEPGGLAKFVAPGLKLGGKLAAKRACEAVFLPYDHSAAEQDVIRILKALTSETAFGQKGVWRQLKGLWPGLRPRILRIIFVFDELDKLEEGEGEEGVDRLAPIFGELLTKLKTLLTASGVTFLFVGGRRLLDVWRADIRRGDSVYESVFSHAEYVPAIFDQADQLCDQLTNSGVDVSDYTAFKRYVAHMGRGVPRRMLRAYQDYVTIDADGRAALVFEGADIRRFRCLAELEDALDAADKELERVRGGRPDPGVEDRDRLALRYLADWMLDRGQEPFSSQEAVAAVMALSPMVRPDSAAAPGLVRAVIETLGSAGFVERLEDADPLLTRVIGRGGEAVDLQYRAVRRRLIELGWRLDSERDDGVNETLLGRYVLEKLLGRGGFGDVFQAHDLRTGETVAVKRLVRMMDAQSRARLEREMEAMRRVSDHPGLVRLRGAYLDAAPPFIVVDIIEGANLAVLLGRRKRLPADVVCAIMRPLLDAVAHLHAHGVYWGDAKPSNVILGAAGQVKLIDYGSTEMAEDGDQTELIGTPNYLAPERILGQTQDARAEVFSIGVLAFQMLTGRVPFTFAELIDLARGDGATPTMELPKSDRTAEIVRPIVLRCLEQDPAARFDSVAALRRALDDAPADEEALQRFIAEGGDVDEHEEAKTVVLQRSDGSAREAASPAAVSEAAGAAGPTEVEDATLAMSTVVMRRRAGVEDEADVVRPALRIVVRGPKGELSRTQLQYFPVSIGRSLDNDIVLDEMAASRYMLRIDESEGVFVIAPLNPTNDAIVDGIPLKGGRAFQDSASIAIGQTTIDIARVATAPREPLVATP